MSAALSITQAGAAFRLRLRVSPKASRDKVAGPHGGALKLAVTAAPERGQANAAVIELLARHLKLARKNIAIISGETSQDKVVEISGFQGDAAALESALLH